MAPVIKKLEENKRINTIVTVTAQHRQMLDQVLGIFNIIPDYDLDLMRYDQNLTDITARVLKAVGKALVDEKPHLILIQGDTMTTFASFLATFYQTIKIGHIEAGLRTNNKYQPFPEEINQRLISDIADFHFGPTEWTKNNLLREGKIGDVRDSIADINATNVG